MNEPMTQNDQMKLYQARNGFTGKTLTNGQFDEAWAISEIMKHTICKTGSFIEKLTDYSHAYARTERFDQMKGEAIIRDIFKDRYGQTMNQMRGELIKREANLPDTALPGALQQARRVESIICDGETRPFYRAYDSAAYTLAEHLNITETGAKELMKTAYREAEGKELYDTGKALEKAHHEPAREAAKKQRAESRGQTQSRKRA